MKLEQIKVTSSYKWWSTQKIKARQDKSLDRMFKKNSVSEDLKKSPLNKKNPCQIDVTVETGDPESPVTGE